MDDPAKAFETARRAVVARYSPESQAYAALCFTYLVELIDYAVATDDEDCWRRVREQQALCQFQLARGYNAGDAAHVRVVDPDSPLLAFRETDEVRLPPLRQPPAVLRVGPQILSRTAGKRHHLYVLTPGREILIHAEPVPVKDLFFPERRSDRHLVRHPQLSPSNAPVVSAGEICFFGANRVEAVLLNTRSGHYRPPPVSADRTREVCRTLFGIPPERVICLVMRPLLAGECDAA